MRLTERGQRCRQDVVARAHEIPGRVRKRSDPTLADPPNAGMDSFRLAIHDGRFAAIREARDQCITAAGYRVEEASETGGVAVDSAWSVEYRLTAALAEAACDDGLGATQGYANIAAGYQNEYIKNHEAELVATKAECDRRLARAHSILTDAGVE